MTTTTALTSPLSSVIDSDLAAALAAEAALGTLRLITRVDPSSLPAGSGWPSATDLEGAAVLRDRDTVARSDAGEVRLDLGSSRARALLTDGVYLELARDWSMSGWDVGGAVGGRGELGYDPPTGDRAHYPHGGSYRTAGTRAILSGLRDLVDGVAVTVGDTVQEHVAAELDLAGEGEQLLPSQAELAAEDLVDATVTDVDLVSRDMTPPLWAIVHGEQARAGRRVMPFTTAPLDTSIFATHRYPGLTSAQWNQLLCYSLACVAIGGQLPILEMPLEFFAHRVRADSTEPCVRFASQVFRALRDTDWCAQFLGYGRAELPLIHTAARDTATNPFSWVKQISPAIVETVGPPGLPLYVSPGAWSDGWSDGWAIGPETPATGHGAMHQPFDVPQVLASFWRDRSTDDLGLVLANWTDAPATWEGRFLPRLYSGWGHGRFSDGWSDAWAIGPAYRIDSLPGATSGWSDGWSDGFGATPDTIAMGTGIYGARTLDFSGTAGTSSGTTIFCGSVPAYSVRAIRIRQE